MVLKETDNQARKERLLGIVVNEYIQTVSPVSSGYIAEKYKLDLSSATIRSVLAELETDGFLTHPHTSAGRMPTQDGYRYYVDYLMKEISLLEEQKKRLRREYDQTRRDLVHVLEKTSEVVANFTHYTSIVTAEGSDSRVFCNGTRYVVEYDYQSLEKIRDLLALLEEKDRVLELINRKLRQKIEIFIGHELACHDMDDCSLALSTYKLPNGRTGRIAVLGPKRMDYQKVVSALDYVSNLIQELF